MAQIRSKQSCFRLLGQIHFGDNINDDVGLNVLECRVDILGTYSINNFTQRNYQLDQIRIWLVCLFQFLCVAFFGCGCRSLFCWRRKELEGFALYFTGGIVREGKW